MNNVLDHRQKISVFEPSLFQAETVKLLSLVMLAALVLYIPKLTRQTSTTRYNDHYSCAWMKTKTNHFKHYSVKVYIGELVGND